MEDLGENLDPLSFYAEIEAFRLNTLRNDA